MIYLDYAATTPVDARVAEVMSGFLCRDGTFANPSSVTHRPGIQARASVEESRAGVADLINASPHQVYWTSGATESDNIAIKGVMSGGGHMVTCASEHPAVLATCRALETQGVSVTYLGPETSGLLDLQELEAALRHDTRLVSIMHVNNELGVIQDVHSIGRICHNRGIAFHVDAAQSAGKIEVDVEHDHVDLLSLTAHKVYGPKGIGALYARDRSLLKDFVLIHGGGQEGGIRAGTLAPHQIAGMGKAFAIAGMEMRDEHRRIAGLRRRLVGKLTELEAVWLNGDQERCLPGILNVGFGGVSAEDLSLALDDIALSPGSACASGDNKPSHVLRAIGLSDERIHSCVRISIGRYTSEADIDQAAEAILRAVTSLRETDT